MDAKIAELKREIVATGRLLWDKDLVTGLNGNISVRVDAERILITATKTCLGVLKESDVLLMKLSGEVLEEGQVSSEKLMHTEVYRNFPETKAVVHTHTPYINGYFLENDTLVPRIFESKFYLGEIQAVPQNTPSVTDAQPVVEALRRSSVAVLKNHGVVAMGKGLFDAFLLIQCLEDAVKIDAVSRLYARGSSSADPRPAAAQAPQSVSAPEPSAKRYKLFSREQINGIVAVVNADKQMLEMGEKTDMTMGLAVKLDETGQVYSFQFEKGRIAGVGTDENAEFLISAPEKIWRAVFNRELDPFVATTQKKMSLRGDFARISRWYAPCSRIFQIWTQVPIE